MVKSSQHRRAIAAKPAILLGPRDGRPGKTAPLDTGPGKPKPAAKKLAADAESTKVQKTISGASKSAARKAVDTPSSNGNSTTRTLAAKVVTSEKPQKRASGVAQKVGRATVALSANSAKRTNNSKTAKNLIHAATLASRNGHHAKAITHPPAKSAAVNSGALGKGGGNGPGKATGKPMGTKPSSASTPAELPANYRPSEKEAFMGSLQRHYFRKKLLQWKDDIVLQNRETLAVLHEDTLQHADLADRATSETDRALELRSRDRQRKLVAKIDAAIARIDDGSYGYCEVTGEPISLKRLDARPIATMTLEAQERHERREKVYRDD